MSGSMTALFFSSLGSFERIELLLVFGNRGFHMGGHGAVAVSPFCGRLGKRRAIPPGCKLRRPVASFTFVHNLMAKPFLVGTSRFRHESTLRTFTNRFTNHWNHPLGVEIKAECHRRPAPLKYRLNEIGAEYKGCCGPCQPKSAIFLEYGKSPVRKASGRVRLTGQ